MTPDAVNRKGHESASLNAAYVVDCAHYVEDGTDEEDNMGFCSPTCACGWKCPPCPDWETAIDFLMQHAYEAGILTERQAPK